jgi:beta-glucosidase
MRRIYVAVAAALAVAAVVAVGVSAVSASPTVVYKNSRAAVQLRVSDLLRRMTLPEKIGQMDQIVVGKLRGPNAPANGDCNGGNADQLQPACLQKVLITDKTGSVLSGGTDNPPDNTGKGWADLYNTVQSYAIEHSRLQIPIIYGVDAVHGFGHPTAATLFPQSIGMGATWDTTLARQAGAATRRQLCGTGTVWDFAPVQDPARDNRWGRYYETWGEEPALSGAIGAANITGMQGQCASGLSVASTVKHFAGYSQSINGHDRVEEQLPIRYLQDFFLPSYAAGINAGADTVMVNSGSINGIPATASHFLLTTELRQRLGFRGVAISDYDDVSALQTTYHIAADLEGAVADAVNAGVDMAMNSKSSTDFDAALIAAVHDGRVSMARINQAVTRILTLKFKLGLFDHPLVNVDQADKAVSGGTAVARQAADESMTLLRNDAGTLPLSSTSKVVVTGPNADSIPNTLGGWSVSWQGVFDNGVQACCAGPPDQIPPAVTAWKGIKAADPSAVLASDQASAVAQAGSTDAYVAVVGELKPYAEGLGDDPSPQLTADQQSLISALQATGKPVIVVVVAGRPLGLGQAAEAATQKTAILMAYLPGTQGGNGVADVLFGKYNPSGKLPVTWPSDAPPPQKSSFDPGGASVLGDQPHFFDQFPGTNSGQGSGYDPKGGATRQPLYPFGFGLSYTTFSTSGLSVSGPNGAGNVTARLTVANTGGREGVDVVPVYVKRPVNSDGILTPSNGVLVGFARVDLMPGQSQSVAVRFSTSELALTPGDIDGTARPTVPSGDYQAVLDPASSTGAAFTIH